MNWFAIATAPRAEVRVDVALRLAGVKTLFLHWPPEFKPLGPKRAQLIVEPYFPGYLFARINGTKLSVVTGTKGVIEILSAGTNQDGDKIPFRIPTSVMDELFSLGDDRGQILFPKKKRAMKVWRRGMRVSFSENNPLFGFFALIEDVCENGRALRVRLEKELVGNKIVTVPTCEVKTA
jgi:hypothetical protein